MIHIFLFCLLSDIVRHALSDNVGQTIAAAIDFLLRDGEQSHCVHNDGFLIVSKGQKARCRTLSDTFFWLTVKKFLVTSSPNPWLFFSKTVFIFLKLRETLEIFLLKECDPYKNKTHRAIYAVKAI